MLFYWLTYFVNHRWKELAKKKKESSIPLKDDDKDVIEKMSAALQMALKKKAAAKSDTEKLKAAADVDYAKAAIKNVRKK